MLLEKSVMLSYFLSPDDALTPERFMCVFVLCWLFLCCFTFARFDERRNGFML